MSEVRVPFCATAELLSPFMLDETYSGTNGVKSILFDKSNLKILGRFESVDLPDYGQVQILVYYAVGTIPYICNAFPIIQSDSTSDVQEASSIFNDMEGNSASDLAISITSEAMGWISASGCVNVEEPIGGAGSFDNMPSIESVTVENLAVANTRISELAPEEDKTGRTEVTRVVKWRGNFVITTV